MKKECVSAHSFFSLREKTKDKETLSIDSLEDSYGHAFL